MDQQKPLSFSLKKRLASFRYAFKGMAIILSTQHNFLIHLVIALVVTILGLILNISNFEWILIILTIAMVLSAEAFNTAIEKLTDLVSPEYDIRAGKVKDIAAASVLITATCSVIIGLIIFLPKMLCYFKI